MTESIQAADLESEALSFETVVIVSATDHPLTTKPVVKTRDLAGETILLSKVDCSYRRSFEQILDKKMSDPAWYWNSAVSPSYSSVFETGWRRCMGQFL